MNKLEEFLKQCVNKGLIIDYCIDNYFENSNVRLYIKINSYNFYIELNDISNNAPSLYYESLLKNKMSRCYNKYLCIFNFQEEI